MLCPRDGSELTQTPNLVGPGSTAQVCPSCAGVTLDWKTTQALFKQLGVTVEDLHGLVAKAASVKRPTSAPAPACTACGKGEMKRFVHLGFELDLCENCGSCWFDRGELKRLTKGRYGAQLKTDASPVAGGSSKVVGVYEMFWDCAFCSATALLGQTHRFCPSCGAAQDATKRYFPPEGQEVAANTTYDGADLVCPACETPNGAKANNCRQCGSPLDGSVEVVRVADRSSAAPRPGSGTGAPKAGGKRWWLWALAAVLVLSCGFCGVAMLWTKDVTVTVAAHDWKREIDIEQLRAVSDDAWCDSMPSGAYSVSRTREERSTKQIANGQECSTRDVDRGNGTFERRRECHTKYRSEPVYDQRCHFTVNRWQTARTLTEKGRGLQPAPVWPQVNLSLLGSMLGAEREGSHRENYSLVLQGDDGKKYECNLNSLKWAAVADGVRAPVKVGVITGAAECDSL